jgi:hypothetical protein
MSQEFAHIEPIRPISLIDTSIIAEIAHDAKLSIPRNEINLLEKSKDISNDLVRAAQERQERWRENVQRFRSRQEKLLAARDRIRTDQGLADRKAKEKQAEKIDDTRAVDRQEIKENIKENELKRIEERQRQDEQIAERKAEQAERAELQAERAQKRKDAELTPEEFREKIETRIADVTERAREKISAQREARKELVAETQDRRRENAVEFRETLHEKVTEVDLIGEAQQARTEAKNALVKSAEELRSSKREIFDQIKAHRDEMVEEKNERTLRHFEKLRQRMKKILADSHSHREESNTLIKHIVSRARERSEAALLASGNPLAQAAALPDLVFFDMIRERIHTILSDSDTARRVALSAKEEIIENARERRDRNMFASGNPKELYKVLGAIEFFQRRREREIFQIVERARERSATNAAIVGLPPERRRELYRVLQRILALLNEPHIKADTFDQNILAIARRNPSLVLRKLAEKIIAHVMKIKNSFIFIRELEHSLNRQRRPAISDSNHAYNPVVQKTIIQSLLKTAVSDSTDNVNLILKNNFSNIFKHSPPHHRALCLLDYLIAVMNTPLQAAGRSAGAGADMDDSPDIDYTLEQSNLRSVFNSFIAAKATIADEIIQENLTARDSQNPVEISTLISLVPPEISRVPQTDELLTVVETPLIYFDSMGKEIKAATGEDIFPKEKILEGKSADEKRAEQHEKDLSRKEKTRAKEQAEKLAERREYLLKLIEEQNMTAHEKVNNERHLLDLFF